MSIIKIIRLEKRYGKPIGEIIGDKRKAGMKIDCIAGDLFMSPDSIRAVLQEIGVGADLRRAIHGCSKGKGGHHRAKYTCAFGGMVQTVRQHCLRYGLSDSSVYRRIWGGMTPPEALQSVCAYRGVSV